MRRRDFICLLGSITALPIVASAQQTNVGRQARIGMISAVPPTAAMLNAFRDELRHRGYVEGQNLIIDVRWPRGTFDQDLGSISGGPFSAEGLVLSVNTHVHDNIVRGGINYKFN